jgi:MFS family permease
LYLIAVTWGFILYAISAAVPQIAADLGISKAVAGLHGTLLSVGGIVAGVMLAPLVRRFGRRRAIAAPLAAGAAACLGLVLGHTVALTLAAVFAMAAAVTLALAVGFAALVDQQGPAAAAATTEANAFGSTAGLLAPAVVGAATAGGLGWRPALGLAIPLALVVAWLVTRLRRSPELDTAGRQPAPRRRRRSEVRQPAAKRPAGAAAGTAQLALPAPGVGPAPGPADAAAKGSAGAAAGTAQLALPAPGVGPGPVPAPAGAAVPSPSEAGTPAPAEAAASAPAPLVRAPQSAKLFGLFATVTSLGCMAEMGIVFWAAQVLVDQTGASLAAAGGALTVYVAGLALGRWAAAPISMRYSPLALLMLAFAVLIGGWAALWTASSLAVAMLGLFVMGFGAAPQYPFGLTLSLLHSPLGLERSQAVLMVATSVAGAAAPFALGWLGDRVGIHAAYAAVPIAVAVEGMVAVCGWVALNRARASAS